MARVLRIASGFAVIGWETVAAMERKRPFVVNVLGTSGRATSFASAWEAEAFAVELLGADRSLFGAVVRYGSAPVSRVVPG